MPHKRSLAAMSAPLLALFPVSHHGDAKPLLGEYLELELDGEAQHPKPARLRDLVVGDLRELLMDSPEGGRLSVLRAQVERSRQQRISREALALAVARYLLAHPDADAGRWRSQEAQAWMDQGEGPIALEASDLLDRLETYASHLQALDPQAAEGQKAAIHATRMALQSARSGSFASAWGPLADFLRDVGADFELLQVRFS